MSSVERLLSSTESTQVIKVVVAFENASPKKIAEVAGYNQAKVKDILAQLQKADVLKKNQQGTEYSLSDSSLAQKIKLSLEEVLIREAGEELTTVLFNVNMAKNDLDLLNAIRGLNDFLEGIHGPVVKLSFQDIVFDLADKLERQIMG
jgi:predicted transcriptional regulator